MKALLICPGERPAVAYLAEQAPLVVVPLLGQSVLEYWLEDLVARGVRHVIILASDRPHHVRATVGDGTRWGLGLEFVAQSRELSVIEARTRFRTSTDTDWPAERDVTLLDHLPGQSEFPLFTSYESWFAAAQAFLPHAASPSRIGARELQPGIWVSLHAQIDPRARLYAPCWIGEHALVGSGAIVGPGAIIEDRVIVEEGARITRSIIGPETFVGELISVENSLVQGATVVNWKNGSCLRVPDSFFLCSLGNRRFSSGGSGLLARILAGIAMLVTAPVALAMMAWSFVRGESLLILRLGVRPQRNWRSKACETFAYYELAGSSNWLHRWPQFWSIVHGDLAWVGNRPLRPTEAQTLSNDFERLWLAAPVGIVSLADAHGCIDELNDETCAHASYYAVNASRRLDWFVLSRAFFRAAFAWPIRWKHRRDAAVRLPQLAGKQQA